MRLLGWIIAVPVALIVIAFAVANRAPAVVRFDPLPYALDIPIWAIAIGAIAFGFVLGAVIKWIFGAKWRSLALRSRRRVRVLEREVSTLRNRLEEERLRREAAEHAHHQHGQTPQRLLPPKDAA